MTDLPKTVLARMGEQSRDVPGEHLDPNLLAAFAEHTLLEKERSAVMVHLSGCDVCRQALALSFPAGVESHGGEDIAHEPAGSWRLLAMRPAWRWIASAALLVCVAATASLYYRVWRASQRVTSTSTVSLASKAPSPPAPGVVKMAKEANDLKKVSPPPVAHQGGATTGPAESAKDRPAAGPPQEAALRRSMAQARAQERLAEELAVRPVGVREQETKRASKEAGAHVAPSSQAVLVTPSQPPIAGLPMQDRNVRSLRAAPKAPTPSAHANAFGSATAGSSAPQPAPPPPAPPVGAPSGQGAGLVGGAYSAGEAGLQGTVTDPSGAVIGNVKVTLSNSATGALETTRTDSQGHYRFNNPQPGDSTLAFESPGFNSLRFDNVRADRTHNINGTLEVGSVTQAVEVSATSPLLGALWSIESWRDPSGKVVGRVQRSVDDGKTWQEVPVSDGVDFRAVAAVGPEVWAGGFPGSLFHSSDAGAHWVKIRVEEEDHELTGAIRSIEAADAARVSITTDAGQKWLTTDAGRNWRLETE
ncbi:MAG: carboxypeptidase regulatory-like domain-containing protein [Terriglobia bacterium]